MISTGCFLDNIKSLVNSNIPVCWKEQNHKVVRYYNIPAAFDIETTSFKVGDTKCATMYIWQFGILNWVTYGRTWYEFINFMNSLSEILNTSQTRLAVYVHNLSFEFQFMRKWLEWQDIFFMDVRKPLYALTKSGIEFRCSYKLSNTSLSLVGKNLTKYKVEKLVGDLDYRKIRNSKTELSQLELKYCENDIRVVISYIQEKIEQDGSIADIPYTNTGYVRNHCRKSCFANYGQYSGLMKTLTLEPKEYESLKDGFAGGFTHASAYYVARGKKGKPIKNVKSVDFTSSYPAVMLMEKFPMSKGIKINTEEMDNNTFKMYLKKYCCLITIALYGVKEKIPYEHPISLSKCTRRDVKKTDVDNGRVVEANMVELTITELDLRTIFEFYNIKNFKVLDLIVYKKAYLPRPFLAEVLNFYKAKTELKGVKGMEAEYLVKKGMANSTFGMTVTDIVRDKISFSNYNDENPFQSTRPDIFMEISDYNSKKNRFLFYPWGVWVCAYARRNLFKGIKECGEDYIYSDTDSIKLVNYDKHEAYFVSYNEMILKKIAAVCAWYKFNTSDFSPMTKKKEVKTIGVWDDDGFYDEFKTLGAKRYMTRKGYHYTITVAGVNKKDAMKYLVKEANRMNREFKKSGSDERVTPFDLFNNDMKIPKEYSGRLVHTYVDTPISGILVDYNGVAAPYEERSYIYLEESEYTMSLSDEYEAFIDKIMNNKEVSVIG